MFERGDRVICPAKSEWGVGHVLDFSGDKAQVFFSRIEEKKKLVFTGKNLQKVEGVNASVDVLDDPLSLHFCPVKSLKEAEFKEMLTSRIEQLETSNSTTQERVKELLRQTRLDFNIAMGQQYQNFDPPYGYKKTSDPKKQEYFLKEAFIQRERYRLLADIASPQLREYDSVLEMMDSNIKNKDGK